MFAKKKIQILSSTQSIEVGIPSVCGGRMFNTEVVCQVAEQN